MVTFFHKCLDDPDRRDFVLAAPDGAIVGEGVINEILWPEKTANFRIAIFSPEHRNRGLGTWMVQTIRDYAFRELGLEELTLEVFAFNPRARHIYEKAGFRVTEVQGDEIIMAVSGNPV